MFRNSISFLEHTKRIKLITCFLYTERVHYKTGVEIRNDVGKNLRVSTLGRYV